MLNVELIKGCSLCLKTLHDLLNIALPWFTWASIVLFYIFAATLKFAVF